MRIKSDRINGLVVTSIKGKNFSLGYFQKPYKQKGKQLNISLLGENSYRIETNESLMFFTFDSSFNVKTELAGLAHKLDTFNLEQESRILNELLEAAKVFNVDYEKRKLAELARGNEYRNWREFYQDMELIQWAQN